MGDSVVEAKSGVTRRTVVKGAAWSVPVIALAVGTPARAASGDVGQVWIEHVEGGTWVNPDYYGINIQIRNNDTSATTLPVEPVTSATIVFTLPESVVGDVVPAVIANAGGSSPSAPALPNTDPTWVAAGAASDGVGNVNYTLTYSGSIAGQGLSDVSFGILGPSSGLISPINYTVTATGSPTDGHVSATSGTLF